MRFLAFAAALCVASNAAVAADAPRPSCIDAGKSYVAKPLNNHDVFVQQTLGKSKPPVRLKTSCIHLEPAVGIRVSSAFICVGLGDHVVASILGSGSESCIVTRVLAYAPEEGDTKKP